MYEPGGGSSSSTSSARLVTSRLAMLVKNPWLVEEPDRFYSARDAHYVDRDIPDIAIMGSSTRGNPGKTSSYARCTHRTISSTRGA